MLLFTHDCVNVPFLCFHLSPLLFHRNCYYDQKFILCIYYVVLLWLPLLLMYDKLCLIVYCFALCIYNIKDDFLRE